jgi:hypothetical protein
MAIRLAEEPRFHETLEIAFVEYFTRHRNYRFARCESPLGKSFPAIFSDKLEDRSA